MLEAGERNDAPRSRPPEGVALAALALALVGISFLALARARVDLRDEVVPEAVQPLPTLAERAAAAGVPIHYLGPAFHQGSGLSRAIGRGQRFHTVESLEAMQAAALRRLDARPALVYGYHSHLDAAGHMEGVVSQAWRDELVAVDHASRLLAEQLPDDTVLVVTGDHGMIDLRPNERLDLADYPDLSAGVTLLAGEARARYVRTAPGAADDVVAAWRVVLGDRMWIWKREEAIATGIFGPQVSDQARERIGDIVAAAYGRVVDAQAIGPAIPQPGGAEIGTPPVPPNPRR